jgi:hypothetical protein
MVTWMEIDDLSGRLRGLVIALGDVLAKDEAREVDHLLEHAEFGEALRTLAWIIVEEDKRIARSHFDEIQTLADRMDMAHELPQQLARHVLKVR